MHDLWRYSHAGDVVGIPRLRGVCPGPDIGFRPTQASPRPEGERDQPPTAHEIAHILRLNVPPSLEGDKEIAGLSATSRPEVLTWERVYALALVRARGGPAPRAEALDPKAIAEPATPNGFDDFGRFRRSSSPHVAMAVGVSTTRAARFSRSWTGSRGSTMRNGMPNFTGIHSHYFQNSLKVSTQD